MGAVNMALLSQLKTGDHFIASDDMFVVSKLSLEDIYTRYGIDHDMVDMTNLDNIRAKFRPNTKVIYLEVLSNPHLKLMDVQAIARLAHERGAKLIVDNTFLSPCLLQPYALGADIVLHSATKYISGHGDALCGVVALLPLLSPFIDIINGWLGFGVFHSNEPVRLTLKRRKDN